MFWGVTIPQADNPYAFGGSNIGVSSMCQPEVQIKDEKVDTEIKEEIDEQFVTRELVGYLNETFPMHHAIKSEVQENSNIETSDGEEHFKQFHQSTVRHSKEDSDFTQNGRTYVKETSHRHCRENVLPQESYQIFSHNESFLCEMCGRKLNFSHHSQEFTLANTGGQQLTFSGYQTGFHRNTDFNGYWNMHSCKSFCSQCQVEPQPQMNFPFHLGCYPGEKSCGYVQNESDTVHYFEGNSGQHSSNGIRQFPLREAHQQENEGKTVHSFNKYLEQQIRCHCPLKETRYESYPYFEEISKTQNNIAIRQFPLEETNHERNMEKSVHPSERNLVQQISNYTPPKEVHDYQNRESPINYFEEQNSRQQISSCNSQLPSKETHHQQNEEKPIHFFKKHSEMQIRRQSSLRTIRHKRNKEKPVHTLETNPGQQISNYISHSLLKETCHEQNGGEAVHFFNKNSREQIRNCNRANSLKEIPEGHKEKITPRHFEENLEQLQRQLLSKEACDTQNEETAVHLIENNSGQLTSNYIRQFLLKEKAHGCNDTNVTHSFQENLEQLIRQLLPKEACDKQNEEPAIHLIENYSGQLTSNCIRQFLLKEKAHGYNDTNVTHSFQENLEQLIRQLLPREAHDKQNERPAAQFFEEKLELQISNCIRQVPWKEIPCEQNEEHAAHSSVENSEKPRRQLPLDETHHEPKEEKPLDHFAGNSEQQISDSTRQFPPNSNEEKVRLHHSRRDPPKTGFSCEFCSRKFKGRQGLLSHMVCHSDERPYHCEICLASFKRPHALRRHMLIHTGEMPFACIDCPAKFRQNAQLKHHARKHTGERPFACSLCPEKFAWRRGLKVHLKTHSDEVSYPCLHCPEKFKVYNLLTEHIAQYHTQMELLSVLKQEYDFSPGSQPSHLAQMPLSWRHNNI